MNKLFAKIAGLTAALAMVAGAGVALANHAEAKGVKASSELTFATNSSTMGTSAADTLSLYDEDSGITLTVDKGTGANQPNPNNSTYLRVQSGNTVGLSSSTGATFTSIVMTASSDDYAKTWSASVGSVEVSGSSITWTGSDSAPVLTNTASAQARIKSVAVTYDPGSTPPTPVTKYSVVFHENGEGVTGMPTDLTEQLGVVSLSNVAEPSREGYTFQGWSLTSDGAVVNQVTVSDANVDVYAIWEAIPEPPAGVTQITLNTTGGTSASNATVTGTNVSYGTNAIKCGTGSVAGAMKLTVGANATLLHVHIAAWNGETVVITPTAEGVTFSPATLALTDDSGVKGNSPFALSGDANNYNFDIAMAGVGDSETSITLSATTGKRFVIWDASYEVGEPPVIVTYDVIFNENGEGVTGMPSNLTGQQPGEVSLSNVVEPSREGYTFQGWSLTSDGAVVNSVTISDANVDVYAIWEAVTPEPTREDLPVGDYEVEVSYAGRTSVPTEEYFEIKEPVGETYYKRLKIEYVGVQFLYSNEYTMPKNNPGKKISVSTDSNAKITSVEVNWYQYENATVYIDGVASSTPSGAKGDNENKISYNINANNFELVNNTNYAQSLWGMKISLSVSAVAEPEVAFDNVETSLQVGDSGTYTATSENATNPVYTWSSDNAEVLSITAGGEYHALKAGSAKVTVDLACDEGADSKSVTVLVSPNHTLTVTEAREIANGLDGDKQETTPYRVKVSGYIVSLDADTKTRAFNLSDSKVSAAGDTIMAYGIYSNDPIRQYAILNGTIEFECVIQNYKGTLEVKDLALVSYVDDAMLFAKGAYEALQESCNVGVQAVNETLWGQIAQVYENQLDEYAKAKLQAADVSNYGQDIINWTARYEIIVSNTSLNNFLSRTIGAGRYVSILPSMMANDGSIVIIAIITIASISAIAALIVIKKRKHQ